jgi:hypothetical protein
MLDMWRSDESCLILRGDDLTEGIPRSDMNVCLLWSAIRVYTMTNALAANDVAQDTRQEHTLMPNNRLIYLGIVAIVVAVSIWLGAELSRRIEWAVPYVGAAGITLVIIGVAREFWKAKKASLSA